MSDQLAPSQFRTNNSYDSISPEEYQKLYELAEEEAQTRLDLKKKDEPASIAKDLPDEKDKTPNSLRYETVKKLLAKEYIDSSWVKFLIGEQDWFNDLPEERIVMLLKGFSPQEQELLFNDKECLRRLSVGLTPDQLVRGIAQFKAPFQLKDKLALILNTKNYHNKHLPYENFRELLLSHEEGIEIDGLLKFVFGPGDEIEISHTNGNYNIKRAPDYLLSVTDKTLLAAAKRAKELHSNKKSFANQMYDDQLKELDKYKLSASETKIVKEILETSEEGEIKEELKKKYQTIFQKYALKVAFDLLDISEQTIGIQSGKLLNEEEDKIITSLKQSASKINKIIELEAAIKAIHEQARINYTKHRNPIKYAKEVSTTESLRIQLNQKYIALKKELGGKHPVLYDPDLNPVDLYKDYVLEDKDSAELKASLFEILEQKSENIDQTRKNLRKDPDLIWKLEGLIEIAKRNINISPALHPIVDAKVEAVHQKDKNISIAIAAFSVAMALASFGVGTLFAAGSAITTGATATIAGLSLGASAIDLYFLKKEYSTLNPASNTAVDPENALTNADPSVIWLIAGVAGVVGDAISLIKLAKWTKLAKFTDLSKGTNGAKQYDKLAREIAEDLKAAGKTSPKLIEEITNALHSAPKLKNRVAAQLLSQTGETDVVAFNKALDEFMGSEINKLYKGKLDDAGELVLDVRNPQKKLLNKDGVLSEAQVEKFQEIYEKNGGTLNRKQNGAQHTTSTIVDTESKNGKFTAGSSLHIEEVIKRFDDTIVENLNKLTPDTRTKLLIDVANDVNFEEFLKRNPAISKAFSAHKVDLSSADLDTIEELLERSDTPSMAKTWANRGLKLRNLLKQSRKFDNPTVLNEIKRLYGRAFGSQITLKVTNKSTGKILEIVPDYLVRDNSGKLKIIDAKFTSKLPNDFELQKALTPNQDKVFGWLIDLKLKEQIEIEVRANNLKLKGLKLKQGGKISADDLGIEVIHSKAENINEIEKTIIVK